VAVYPYFKIAPSVDDFPELRASFHKRKKFLMLEFLVLLVMLMTIAVLYFVNVYSKRDKAERYYPSKEQYELGFFTRELNKNQIKALDNAVVEKNNELLQTYSLESLRGSGFDRDTGYLNLNQCYVEFSRLLKLMPDRISAVNNDTTLKIVSGIENITLTIRKIPADKCTSRDLKSFEHMLNMPKALLQKANALYSKNWYAFLLPVQRNGLLIFFFSFVFLLTVWLQASLANLHEIHETEKQAEAEKRRGVVSADSMVAPDKASRPVVTDISAIKTIISVIILLIIPIFKPISKESIQLDKSLWQVTKPDLLPEKKNIIFPEPRVTVYDSVVLTEDLKKFIRDEKDSLSGEIKTAIENSKKKLFKDLKGK
jgi:hypothetical protein